MDPQKITELANLLRNNGDKILNSEFNFTLSGSLLRALNDSFTLIADAAEIGPSQTFQVVKPINSKSSVFRDLQLVHDFVQKTAFLCIIRYPGDDEYLEGHIDITKFRSLKRLELQKTNVKQLVGIQPLRAQIQQLICVKSLHTVDDIITHCGGDNANGFVWNELKIADFSYNQLQSVDTALEFAQYLQHLNLRHNQLVSVEAIKWLPNLKTLDLSFNRLNVIPQFHLEACKRLQVLNMSNNLVEDLLGLSKLDALTDLDLSDNCLLDHSYLLPLSAVLTLKYLNLYGNPLHCHPKHRLATSQFLHKNTATVKFILDFEPLSKNERAITGSQQMRRQANTAYHRYPSSKGFISIGSSRSNSSTQGTPASSVGSQRSFRFVDSSTSAAAGNQSQAQEVQHTKKRAAKVRNVEIAEFVGDSGVESEENIVHANAMSEPKESMTKSLQMETEENSEHLTAKRHIETLRKKYGNEWLQSENAQMMQSVLGIEPTPTSLNSIPADEQRNKSRQLFQDYLGEFSSTAPTISDSDDKTLTSVYTSTPTNDSYLQDVSHIEQFVSPIKSTERSELDKNSTTMYMSINNSNDSASKSINSTLYASAIDVELKESKQNLEGEPLVEQQEVTEEDDDMAPHLKNVYSTTVDDEPAVSEAEDDEETYIVYTAQRNEAMFLTLSSNFLREKDTLTQRTKNKWSLKILESCDRIKSNTLRINFDTVKLDKQERVYTIEDGLCQELEKKLRDILSQRELCEMNQTIYRCVNCTCQFSRENKNHNGREVICCPDCKSNFVAEIHDIPKSLEKTKTAGFKLSPAAIALPIEEGAAFIPSAALESNNNEETNSIGSANSLNESSSCSKISYSNSSYGSNQSVVGSSNTERDTADFKLNYESDVDIISNPSISSIEVLDHHYHGSRKTSEERGILHVPNLETIEDNSFTQDCTPPISLDNIGSSINEKAEEEASAVVKPVQLKQSNKSGALAHFNLTESSSSGSVTDSVCTAYEQAEKTFNSSTEERKQITASEQLLQAENAQSPANSSINNYKINSNAVKKEDSGISSMFGALFQSTNILMSSSKKLLDAEASANIQAGIISSKVSLNKSACTPYKFNYTDFSEVDHRIKLFFYQSKFEEAGEHFKWLVSGRIYNANTHTVCSGIVVMSTCKCYVMEAVAAQHDDVTKWLRQIVSVTVDRLESIQLLPWKIGLSFQLRDWGGFLLLLQDILRTDSLLLHFANNSLPTQCDLKYHISDQIVKRLNNAAVDEKIKMLSLLNGCEIKCENAKRAFALCSLITTDTRLYLTSGNMAWLYARESDSEIATSNETDLELCITQFMSNLVEVERPADNIFTINFLDETQDKYELWKCTFETKENAESCFNAIGQSWEMLFGVPLFTTVAES